MLRIKLVLLLGLFTAPAMAQEMQEFMDRALEENYQLHISRIESVIAENNNTAGNAGFLPIVDLTGQYTYSWSTTRQNFFNGDEREGNNARNTGLNGSIAINQTLFDGFRMFAARDQLTVLESLGEVNVRFAIDQTLADIATIYFQLIKEHEILNNYRRTIKVSEYRTRLEQRRSEIGAGTALDYQQSLVAFQNDSSLILSQKSIIRTLEIELNRITNRDLDMQVELASDSLSVERVPFSRSAFLELIDSKNQAFRQAQLQELLAETEVRIQKAEMYPIVSAFGGYSYNRSTSEIGFVESNRSYGPNIGIGVRFNLFNGGNARREWENAGFQQDIAVENKEQIKLDLEAELINTYAQYEFLLERIALAQQSVQAASKGQRIADAQLREGAINGIDYRVNQVTLINAENALAQLKFSLKALEVNLLRLTSQVMEVYL
jgi:outer membrane protein TolC